MKNKKIAVLLKYYKGELNPFDCSALECALESGAKEIVALTMAPPTVKEQFRALTRLGVKGVMISDNAYAGSDTQATSYILAKAIEKLQPDLIFCGRQSVDGDTAQVPPMLAQRLGFAIKTKVMQFNENGVVLRDGEHMLPQEKTVLTFEKIRTLRFPSIFSKLGEIEIWDNHILQLPKEKCGLLGSPTKVVKSYESNVGRRNCQFVGIDALPALIKESLQKQRIEQTQETGEKLESVGFVGNIQTIAERLGKHAICLNVNGKTVEETAEYIQTLGVKTVLWEDSEEYKILASKTAVLLNAGICADCISFRVEQGKCIFTRPALSGNITADILSTSDVSFATVRTVKRERAQVIFSIGKGAVEYIDKIQALAKEYEAEICCSRAVADSGKLPYEKQVGLTGKTVSPKVYVAFGISGAVQHTCAIAGAGTVIAVNMNKDERIFDYADYGIIADIKTL